MNKIFEYQNLDSSLRKIESELKSTEERKRMNMLNQHIKEIEKTLFSMDTRASELTALITKAMQEFSGYEKEVKDCAKQLKSLTNLEKIAQYNRKLQDISSDMTKLENDIRNLAREMNDISGKYDKYSNDYPLAKKMFAEAKSDFDRLVEGRKDEANALKSNMKELESKLDAVIADKYRKLVSQGIFPPIVELTTGDRCGGCMMELPSGQVLQLKSKSTIECENCRRIIVLNK